MSQVNASSSSASSSSDKLKGYEILSFEGVELTKTENGQNQFVDLGVLHVLYFEENVRFLLNINHWNYPLLKRFNFTASSKSDFSTRSYTFPSEEGYYTLKLTKIPHPQSLVNLDTILAYSTTFLYQGGEVPEGVIGASILASDELSGRESLKKKLARLTDKIAKHLIPSNNNNLNLSNVKSIDELKNVHVDYLSVHEYPRDNLDWIVNEHRDFSRKAMEKAEEMVLNQARKEKEVDITITTINPRKPEEDQLISEIEKERKIQEEARRGIAQLRNKEIESIVRERELQDKLLRRFDEITIQHISFKEESLKKEQERTKLAVLESQKHMNLERKEFEERENELIEEINKRLNELRAKEIMTEQDHVEFARREQQLKDINEKVRFEAVELEESQNELKEYIKLREQELANKINLTEEEKAELKRRKKNFKREILDRMSELHQKKQLTKEEQKELKRRSKELEKLQQLKDDEKKKLEKEKLKYLDKTALELAKLQSKQLQVEEERKKFEQKNADLQKILNKRLSELKEKEALTEEERIELHNKEHELQNLTILKETEKFKLDQLQKDFKDEVEMRESAIKELQKVIEQEKKKLNDIADELANAMNMTEARKQELELQRKALIDNVRAREQELESRERATQEELEHLERKREMAGNLLNQRENEIQELKKLNQRKEVEIIEKQEEIVRIDNSRGDQIKEQQEQLNKIKRQEENLLAHNIGMMKGEMKIQGEIDKLGDKIEGEVQESFERKYLEERVVREKTEKSQEVYQSNETSSSA